MRRAKANQRLIGLEGRNSCGAVMRCRAVRGVAAEFADMPGRCDELQQSQREHEKSQRARVGKQKTARSHETVSQKSDESQSKLAARRFAAAFVYDCARRNEKSAC